MIPTLRRRRLIAVPSPATPEVRSTRNRVDLGLGPGVPGWVGRDREAGSVLADGAAARAGRQVSRMAWQPATTPANVWRSMVLTIG